MRTETNWKRLIILAWACALAFGLTFQIGQADALHSSCSDQCVDDCEGSGGCGGATGGGCFCFWICVNGTSSDSICV